MKATIRRWLGITNMKQDLQKIESELQELKLRPVWIDLEATKTKQTIQRQAMEALQAAMKNPPAFTDEQSVERTIRKISEDAATTIMRREIDSERFLDAIIKRIRDKQLHLRTTRKGKKP